MTKSIDILGLGCVAVDDLLYVPSFPVANTKVRVLSWERQCGRSSSGCDTQRMRSSGFSGSGAESNSARRSTRNPNAKSG
jgi:hypothetical protein